MFEGFLQPIRLVLILGIILDARELARTIALVSHGRRRSVELLESTGAGRPTDSCSSEAPDADDPCNLSDGEPLTTQLDDAYPRSGTRRGTRKRGASSDQ